ncbi:hypothetical protein FBU30_007866 [Linnemannia zychae]|nr:hypothetical protein FBU30_007866 [Linnemannia zychae]
MKIFTIFSALIATAAPAVVIAALVPTFGTPPIVPVPNEANNYNITYDTDLFASIVKCDCKTTDDLIARFKESAESSGSLGHTNVVAKAAAPSSDNKMNCDTKGRSALFVFTAHTKFNKHHTPYPMSMGNAASSPDRSWVETKVVTYASSDYLYMEVYIRTGRFNAGPYRPIESMISD